MFDNVRNKKYTLIYIFLFVGYETEIDASL